LTNVHARVAADGQRELAAIQARQQVAFGKSRTQACSDKLGQPVARLIGRIAHGLSPWRRFASGGILVPRAVDVRLWRETWRAHETWLEEIAAAIRERGVGVASGGVFDAWDLEVRAGLVGTARILVAIEEHGQGRQLARVRARGRASRLAAVTLSGLIVAGALAGFSGAIVACVALSVAGAAVLRQIALDLARSLDATREALSTLEAK